MPSGVEDGAASASTVLHFALLSLIGVGTP